LTPPFVRTSIRPGRPSVCQSCWIHGPTATTTWSTATAPWSVNTLGDRPARGVQPEPADGNAGKDLDALGPGQAGQAVHRLLVERKPALVLVQAGG